MSDFKHIGTVEILRARTYSIDPYNKNVTATEAIVMPGVYPLLSDGYSYLWMMTGNINGNFLRRGDGLFIGGPRDAPIDNLVVTFPSLLFGPEGWADMLNHPICIEGHDEQRLRITIDF